MSKEAQKLLNKMDRYGWSFYDLEDKVFAGKFKGKELKAAIELIGIWRD